MFTEEETETMQEVSDLIFKFENDFNMFQTFGIWGTLIGLLFAVIYCFFGYKLVKVFVTIFGVLLGATLGVVLARLLGFNEAWFLVSIVLGMIIFGVLAFFVYRLGLAFMVGISSFGILMSLTRQFLTGNAVWVVAVIAAILVGVTTLWAARPVVIIISSISGGFGASGILFHELIPQLSTGVGYVQDIVVLIVGVILAVFGLIVQFRRKS